MQIGWILNLIIYYQMNCMRMHPTNATYLKLNHSKITWVNKKVQNFSWKIFKNFKSWFFFSEMKVTLRNLIIQARQEIVATVLESTKSTRIFCAVLTLFSLLSSVTAIDEIFGITPGKLWDFYSFKFLIYLFLWSYE